MKCGHCEGEHHEVDTVRACSQGRVFACNWLVNLPTGQWNDFEPVIGECGASAVADDRGFRCEAGHEHVNEQARYAEGWDYASDEQEAAQRAKYGYESRLPDGHVFIG